MFPHQLTRRITCPSEDKFVSLTGNTMAVILKGHKALLKEEKDDGVNQG